MTFSLFFISKCSLLLVARLVWNVGGTGGERGQLDTAHTGTVSGHLESDVACFTPLITPGVTDDVVGSAIRASSVSNSGNGVVEVGTASFGLIEDTTLIVVEGRRRSVDRDGDDTLGDGGLQGTLTFLSDLSMLSDINLAISGHSGVASWSYTITRDVWILIVCNLVVGFKVVEDMWLVSTIASVVSVGLTAGDELLLRKVGEIISIDEDGSLNDSG